MIYLEKPEKFNPKFEIVSCFFEWKGKFLLLHRQDAKPQGNTWGVPAGKVEQSESLVAAMTRELKEETGYPAEENKLSLYQSVYVRYPEYDFIYHIFRFSLLEKPEIVLDPSAHKAFKWVSPSETKSVSMNLIRDMDACIDLFYFKEKKNGFKQAKHAASIRGFDETQKELAQNIHRMKYDVVEKFYDETISELCRQASCDRRRGRHKLAAMLEQAIYNADEQRKLFKKMWALCEPYMEEK